MWLKFKYKDKKVGICPGFFLEENFNLNIDFVCCMLLREDFRYVRVWEKMIYVYMEHYIKPQDLIVLRKLLSCEKR